MKSLLALFLGFVLCLSCSATSAQLTVYAKSSIGPSEPFRVVVESTYDELKDVYVALYSPSKGLLFFITSNKTITVIPSPYATSVKKFSEVVFDYTFEQITPVLAGEWYVLVAAIPPGQDVYSVRFTPETFQAIRLQIRQSAVRNTSYLSHYLQELQSGSLAHLAGVYNDRLLSVYYPEIYLQADDLFLYFLSLVEGSAWFYDKPPEEISSLYDFLPRERGPSLTLDKVDLSLYETVREDEIYQEPIPYLNWFDRRVMPIHFILKAQKRFGLYVTPLEKAFLVYFVRKYVNGADPSRLFIAYALDGSAYVVDRGRVYDPNGEETSSISRPVILVFNERSVFYPLMGRDDRTRDPYLEEAVSLVKATENPTPLLELLSDYERQALEILKETTGPLTDNQKEIMRVSAANIEYLFIHRLYDEGIFSRADPIPGWTYEASLFHFRVIGSSLSPFSDHLARILLESGYQSMSSEFLSFNQWGGETVSVDSVSYTIDAGFRADVGSCKDLSTYAAAALEVAGKDWYRLRGVVTDMQNTYSHFFVYVPEDEAYLDNGYYIDGSFYGYRYAIGGVPNAGLPSLDNYGFDTFETPSGFAFWRLYDGTFVSVAFGSFSKNDFQNLLQRVHQDANPKPAFHIYTLYTEDSTFTKVIDILPFEEGLSRVLKLYQQYQW